MIIAGTKEGQPDSAPKNGTSHEPLPQNYDHATDVSFPLIDLADRHARGANALQVMTLHGGPSLYSDRIADLAKAYAEKSKSAQATAAKVGHMTLMLMDASAHDLSDFRDVINSGDIKSK